MIRTGPNFIAPPRELVAQIALRAGKDFWPKFTRGIDEALKGRNGTLVNWYRSAPHNARVGGELDSQHRFGTAIDVQLDTWDRYGDVVARLRRAGYFVVDEVRTKNHLHVQAFPKGALRRAGVRPGA